MNVGSLFTGGMGLDLGLEAAGLRVEWGCDSDPNVRRLLAHRRPGLEVFDDVRLVDDFRAVPVDVLAGGFPCPDFSIAGRRLLGFKGERAQLWHEMARCVRVLRPRFVLVENVRGLLAGLGLVLADLAECGYVGRWLCIRASDLGAPHRRERLFVVAERAALSVAERARVDAVGRLPRGDAGGGNPAGPAPLLARPGGEAFATDALADCAGALADADGSGLEGSESTRRRNVPAGSGRGPAVEWGVFEPAVRRWERIFRPAPGPVDARGRLEPRFVEWMLGYPDEWTAVPGLSRSARLRILGNSVQVQVGELVGRMLVEAAA